MKILLQSQNHGPREILKAVKLLLLKPITESDMKPLPSKPFNQWGGNMCMVWLLLSAVRIQSEKVRT